MITFYENNEYELAQLDTKDVRPVESVTVKMHDVVRYAALMLCGALFPPAWVREVSPGTFVLAEGHRRHAACKLIGKKLFAVICRDGSRRKKTC